jgi:hypothetical protein
MQLYPQRQPATELMDGMVRMGVKDHEDLQEVMAEMD